MEEAAQPLLGYTYNDPYNMITNIVSAIWYARIFVGVAILLTFVINSLYIANSDTELWRMENIELTKRIAAYQGELDRRNEQQPISFSENLISKRKIKE